MDLGNFCRSGRGESLADRYERVMYRFADLVRASIAWWVELPIGVRVVILWLVGMSGIVGS